MILCVLLLSSCGFPSGKKTSDSPAKTIGNTSSQNDPLNVPPIAGDRPDGMTGELQPPRGINLFPADVTDDTARINRLENAVQSLRNDFDKMAPTITRLTAVEGDLETLIEQLETLLTETEPAATPAPAAQIPPTPLAPAAGPIQQQPQPPMQPKAQAQPPVAPQHTAAPQPSPSTTGENSIVSIRIGEHPDKTRIVLDVRGDASFTHDIDNIEKILIVELPGTKWAASAQSTYSRSPLLTSHRTDTIDNGAGTRLILQLKSPASVIYSGSIKGKKPGEKRIILDLGPDHSGASTQ